MVLACQRVHSVLRQGIMLDLDVLAVAKSHEEPQSMSRRCLDRLSGVKPAQKHRVAILGMYGALVS